MATISVFQQYYSATCVFNDVERRAASVLLISDSESGIIRYEAAVSFFPHSDPEDFAVSYDAYASKVLYEAAGRRSKKREASLLQSLHEHVDELASSLGGTIDWNSPLGEARLG